MRSTLLWIAVFTGSISTVVTILVAGGLGLNLIGYEKEWLSTHLQVAAAFFVPSITLTEIHEEYQKIDVRNPSATQEKVKILLVPGHQPEKGGTQFKGVYERDVVVAIAHDLATLLSQNPRYSVVVSRTQEAWNPILQSYFDTHALEIETFRQSQALQMQQHVSEGDFVASADQVYHNTASSEAVLQLYGMNKWASDNDYQVVLHLHLNDYAGRRPQSIGTYDGFAIYVPHHQYSNATVSTAIGEAIAARLSAYHAVSTLPKEDRGVVEDQELIAIGSNNSIDGAALLIEYGYIYEPQLSLPSVRAVAVADYAYQTYLGIQDFFKDPIPSRYGSLSFPYDWENVTGEKGEKGPEVYALQAALHFLKHYPPSGNTFSQCPVSGISGDCTEKAIKEYQLAQGLEETGTLGVKTRAALRHDLTPSSALVY